MTVIHSPFCYEHTRIYKQCRSMYNQQVFEIYFSDKLFLGYIFNQAFANSDL